MTLPPKQIERSTQLAPRRKAAGSNEGGTVSPISGKSPAQIEAEGKMHPDERELLAEQEEARKAGGAVTVIRPPDKAPPVDPKTGQVLLFDGYTVPVVESQIVGDLAVEANVIPQYSTGRFEGTWKLLEVTHKDRKGTLVRFQKLFVEEVVLVPDSITAVPREEIEARLARFAQDRAEVQQEEGIEIEGGQD
jgi:hypothetical protein